MNTHPYEAKEKQPLTRVVVVGLASCFGCQLQITNIEKHLLDVLGRFDLKYWQLCSSDPMPEEFDIAIIEGAVTTEDAVQTLIDVRKRAAKVITIGACANTAGIPGIVAVNHDATIQAVYGGEVPEACGTLISPRPVAAVIDVDYEVPCCPIDPYEFLEVLSRALVGSNRSLRTATMCGECKRNETTCFYAEPTLCLGMVTRSGCGARCVNLGRPCNGCRGISPDANLRSAREAVERAGLAVEDFNRALEMFNQVNPVCEKKD